MVRLSKLLILSILFLSTGCDEDVVIGQAPDDSNSDTSSSTSSPEDFDSDGLSDDVEEENRVGSEPMVRDTDRDGFDDGMEFISQSGDPLNSLVVPASEARARNLLDSENEVDLIDSDGDGLGSNFENNNNLDDNNADIDDDGFSDSLELVANTDPFNASSVPIRNQPPASDGIDPTTVPIPLDSDGDGISNDREAFFGYDPNDRDTDGDGFSDNIEYLMGSVAVDQFNVPNFFVPSRPES